MIPATPARRFATLACLLSLLGLAGCYEYVPVVRPVPLCEPKDREMLAACEASARLTEGQTYGDALKSGIDNEARLARCAARHQALADAMRLCNDEYRKLNREIDAANLKIEGNNRLAGVKP